MTLEVLMPAPVRSAILAGLVLLTAVVHAEEVPSGFRMLVWQYQTNAQADIELYRRLNLGGFHIDRGAGQQSVARWASQQGVPYYVDHAAGKGILHLTERSGLSDVPRDGTPAPRPWSFFDPATTQELKSRLDANVPPVAQGPVLAIALDDEVSLGHFNAPLEVDYSPRAVKAFRDWLLSRYTSAEEFRIAWGGASFSTATPVPFEQVRRQIRDRPPAEWRLAPWVDFRTFHDERQADLFRELVAYTDELAPGVPAGVVGGQQPSAYGGFDYSRLRHALGMIEAYDIGGTNELLHSFWSEAPRPVRYQTYFASGNASRDQWFLWYYLAHGNRGVIVWPTVGGKPWFAGGEVDPRVNRLAETFRDVQAEPLGVLSEPQTTPVFSPVAILYSHPSVQVGWAIDASTHGKTWPRRSSSLDNGNLSSGKSRVAWSRLLEDLGHQARFIDTTELTAGFLSTSGTRVLILPQAFALSRAECEAITTFVRRGGTVIADYGTAITNEHGTGYAESPLDDLFGIDRTRDAGWFDGRRRYELDGERYNRPFAERFPTDTLLDNGLPVVERSLQRTVLRNEVGNGAAIFLNTSPTRYFDADARAGAFGTAWRTLLGRLLRSANVTPSVRLVREDGTDFGVELLRYRTGEQKEVWAVVANPTRQASVDGPGSGLRLESKPIRLRLETDLPIDSITDLRTGQPTTAPFTLPPAEALVLEVTFDE